MGVVYKAFDQHLKRIVALKTVHRELISDMDEIKSIDRLRDEAQAGGCLNHPNIVTVFDYGENSSVAYIAMEFVEGTSLAALLAPNRPVALSSVSVWMTDLLEALDFIHERGIVHRDIKPSNLLITQSGRLKVSDFGVAYIGSSASSHIRTRVGTPSYMSPEQFRGEAIDGRSDIFSAGLVLYQLLTGTRAFTGTTHEVMHQIFNVIPTPPSQRLPSLGGAFDCVVAKALAKSFSNRYGSAHKFLDAFRLTHSTNERTISPLSTAVDNNAELSL